MKRLVLCVVCLIGYLSIAQEDEKERKTALRESTNLTWEGNKELSENNFIEAEVDYRKAIAKSDENHAAPYNLGNAYYNNDAYAEAFGRFKQAGELAEEKGAKHQAYHNMGNVFMKRKEYEKAVEAYKEALRNNPTDDETRYNLALAKEMLKKEQEEQKNDQNNDENKDNQDQKDKQDQNEDQKEGDNKEDQQDEGDKGDQGDEEKDENKEGEGDEKEEQKKQPDQGDKPEDQQQEQQPRPNQLSKQQIQNLLDAMQNEEKKVQEKIDAQKVKGVKVKNEKDW